MLTKADYPFLSYDSYVSSLGIVAYDDVTINGFGTTATGTISKAHMKEIMHVLNASKTLERQQKTRICAALHAL